MYIVCIYIFFFAIVEKKCGKQYTHLSTSRVRTVPYFHSAADLQSTYPAQLSPHGHVHCHLFTAQLTSRPALMPLAMIHGAAARMPPVHEHAQIHCHIFSF